VRFSTIVYVLTLLLSVTAIAAVATIEGVYENAQANASVEFLAGGKAHFSFHGVGGECTYKITGDKIALTCDGEVTNFTINADGSLTGPPDSFVARLKKKK
jgi:hypothetical protein